MGPSSGYKVCMAKRWRHLIKSFPGTTALVHSLIGRRIKWETSWIASLSLPMSSPALCVSLFGVKHSPDCHYRRVRKLCPHCLCNQSQVRQNRWIVIPLEAFNHSSSRSRTCPRLFAGDLLQHHHPLVWLVNLSFFPHCHVVCECLSLSRVDKTSVTRDNGDGLG